MLQMWKDCFDCLYEEGDKDPKFMMWGNHPFVGGRPSGAPEDILTGFLNEHGEATGERQ